uniref:O-antigen polymerase n=1 Tax=Algoriphagus sp. TaxID=1872435 RepID=UPI00404710E8
MLLFLAVPSLYYEWKFLSGYKEVLYSKILFLFIFIAYISIIWGYRIGSKKSLNQYPTLKFYYGEHSQFLMIVIFFFICLIAFFLYAYGHGGIIDLVLSGKDIRAKREHAGIFQYFGYFASGLTFNMLLFYSFKSYSKKYSILKWSNKFFILSIIFALIYAVGTAGRGNIGMIFVYLFLFYFVMNSPKLNLKSFLIFFSFSIFLYFLVAYGKSAIWTLNYLGDGPVAYIEAFSRHRQWYVSQSASTSIIEGLLPFFSQKDHALASLYVAIYYPDVYQTPRFFLDWPRAFLELIPGISQPEFIVSSTPSGLGRNFFGKDGYVPPGWIAMKIINGGLAWLFVGSLVSGYIGGWLNRFLIKNWFISPIVPGVFIYMALFWNDSIVGIDPFMFFLPNLATFLFIIIVGWMVEFKIKKKIKL